MGDQVALVLLVRFRTSLTPDEVVKVAEKRMPEFRALSGLTQKFYLKDASTGEYAGLYLWDSAESLDAFRRSELRASIAESYKVIGAPRIEVYNVLRTLRDEEA